VQAAPAAAAGTAGRQPGALRRVFAIVAARTGSSPPVTYTRLIVTYVAGLVVLSGVLLALTWKPIDDWSAGVVLSVAIFLFAFTGVEVIPGTSLHVDSSSLVSLGLSITFGPVGCLFSAVSASAGVAARLRHGWFRATFNCANYFVANWLAYTVYSNVDRWGASHVLALTAAGACAGTVQYFANNIGVAGVVAIATSSSFPARLRSALVGNWYTVFFGWGTALFPVAYAAGGTMAVTWVLAPLAATQALLVVFGARVRAHTAVRNQLMERLQEESARVERSYDATLVALTHALDARDRETEGHSRRVVEYTREIATLLGVVGSELTTLSHGALLHDIGKIGVPDAILHKPGDLTEEEWDIMRRHPQIGSAMVEDIEVLKEARWIILHHHERWDGQGYPKGLRGGQITKGARIFAVADAVDAITQDRPYRLAMSLDRARVELQRFRGRQFDPDAVDAFLSIPEARLLEIQRVRTPVNIDVLNDQAARTERYLARTGLGVAALRRRAG
jgi:HD-GYP domain-containing protein (c-di-GMP phosphodiesterase class II)